MRKKESDKQSFAAKKKHKGNNGRHTDCFIFRKFEKHGGAGMAAAPADAGIASTRLPMPPFVPPQFPYYRGSIIPKPANGCFTF
ncbi:hypothetical protein [Neisseria canis]|uniref:hypothetical protein n=1 Tax=Neisseria canis TaxID=493 RepID=UPI001E4BDE3F|nr:hypothetical protein [Neisseria canis]